MTVSELNNILQEMLKNDPNSGNLRVVIEIQEKGMMGSTPCTDINQVTHGFDWNSGKLMISPKDQLQKVKDV